jgi:hypothetical protein
LAKYGFLYAQLNDIIQCAFCRIVICGYKGDTDITEFHKLYSDWCPFVNGTSNNIALQDIDRLLMDYSSEIPKFDCNVNGFSDASNMISDSKTEIDRLLCKICFENEVTILLNCKHLVICTACSSSILLKTCPVCRTPIEYKIKIYLS